MPKNQKSLISLFFESRIHESEDSEHPRKVTKIANFLLFGMTINDARSANDYQ